jgi:hypothetical protein
MFQDGATFGSAFTVRKTRAINSDGWELAYRPHIDGA